MSSAVGGVWRRGVGEMAKVKGEEIASPANRGSAAENLHFGVAI